MIKKIAFSIVLLFGIFTMPFTVAAQDFIAGIKRPMPDIKLTPEIEFQKTATLYQEKPYGDDDLAYRVFLPAGWTKAKSAPAVSKAEETSILGDMATFFGPPNMHYRSRFSVQFIDLPHDMTAEQWAIQYMIAQAFASQGMKVHDVRRCEFLYVKVEDGVSYAVRSVVVLNGGKAVLASYTMPMDMWEDEKIQQANVIAGFTLTAPNNTPVSKLLQYQFLDIAELQYPEGWEMRAQPVKSIDRTVVDFLSIQKREKTAGKFTSLLNGKITVSIASGDAFESVSREIADFRNQIAGGGLTLEAPVRAEKDDLKLQPGIDSRPIEISRAKDRSNALADYEVWVKVMQAGDYFYFMSLLTPSADENYTLWVKNTNTFRIMVESVKPEGE